MITWILYGFAHAVSMYFIVPVSVGGIAVDAAVHAGIVAVLGLLLRHILRYGKYETLPPIQRNTNYTVLAGLMILCWLSIGYLLDYLFLKETATLFLPTLSVRVMIGLFLYLIFILLFSQTNKQVLEQNKDLDLDLDLDKTTTPAHEIMDRITVKTGQKLHIIPLQEILYIQSDGDYVQLITKNGKHLKEQTMKFFETHLPQNLFVRTHRSYIVNIEHISRIESDGRQNQQIVLKNGQWLRVSLSGYKSLKETLRL